VADLDPYKVLQVDPEAEDEVIQAAYRRLAQKYHPDRRLDSEGAARMVAINAAWEMVGEPAKRAAYDRSRLATAPQVAVAPEQSPGGGAARPSESGSGPARPAGPAAGRAAPSSPPRPPETVSRDWTSGRSASGGGYDSATMRKAEGEGAAGPPPGKPSGSVLKFGRYAGWSIGEIARSDLEYLEWLDRMAIGRVHRDEIDAVLRSAGRRRSASAEAADRRGLFRRR
jgi:curved DNA-binding protein CbpA